MTTRVLIFSQNIKSITSKKNGFVANFVKSGSMEAVFTNYIFIIYYIFIVFLLFSHKVPFVNINLSDGQHTFQLGSALILALISSNMFYPAGTRHLQDILGLSWNSLVSITHFQDIYKTSWNCLVSITHFQDIYKTSSCR